MTHAISSGLACFAEAEVKEGVSEHSREEQPAKTNIGRPISHKSWLVHGDQAQDPTERLRIRYPVEVIVP
jgi:hypothetical protein